jgi:hypothetical protein
MRSSAFGFNLTCSTAACQARHSTRSSAPGVHYELHAAVCRRGPLQQRLARSAQHIDLAALVQLALRGRGRQGTTLRHVLSAVQVVRRMEQPSLTSCTLSVHGRPPKISARAAGLRLFVATSPVSARSVWRGQGRFDSEDDIHAQKRRPQPCIDKALAERMPYPDRWLRCRSPRRRTRRGSRPGCGRREALRTASALDRPSRACAPGGPLPWARTPGGCTCKEMSRSIRAGAFGCAGRGLRLALLVRGPARGTTEGS